MLKNHGPYQYEYQYNQYVILSRYVDEMPIIFYVTDSDVRYLLLADIPV